MTTAIFGVDPNTGARIQVGTIELTTNSIMTPIGDLKPSTVDAIRNATIAKCVAVAAEKWGANQALTIRDLNALDMSYTYNVFSETSHATLGNAWNAMGFGAFTVADGTVLGIYGIKLLMLHDGAIDQSPISAIRIEVGGSRVAQWSIQQIDDMTSASSLGAARGFAGVTLTPVIIQETIQVTCYEYTRTTNTAYEPTWLGVAVEKEGLTLRP